MFRKFLIFAMFATAAGYCFADSYLPQVTTSEVFTNESRSDSRVRETDRVRIRGSGKLNMPHLKRSNMLKAMNMFRHGQLRGRMRM